MVSAFLCDLDIEFAEAVQDLDVRGGVEREGQRAKDTAAGVEMGANAQGKEPLAGQGLDDRRVAAVELV